MTTDLKIIEYKKYLDKLNEIEEELKGVFPVTFYYKKGEVKDGDQYTPIDVLNTGEPI